MRFNVFDIKCRDCARIGCTIKDTQNHVGLYCASCGAWQKWLGKEEYNEIVSGIKSDNPDDIGEGLRKINAKLDHLTQLVKLIPGKVYERIEGGGPNMEPPAFRVPVEDGEDNLPF